MRGEAARPGKRPLRSLSAAEKMDAIQRVHEGESKASVARDIGVPESTLRGWCKSEHKIRDMARRSSSTPDSDPHSPASSSGGATGLHGAPGASSHSSEDEAALPSGPLPKRMKLESSMSGASLLGDVAAHESLVESLKLHQQQQQLQHLDSKHQQQSKLDYVNTLLSSFVAGGVRPENHALLMQQLGLLQTATSAANLTKNLLNLTGSGLGSSSSSQAVGLVENGLQYSKSSAGSSGSLAGKQRNSIGSAIVSAIAPTSQLEQAKQDGRKSLPTATSLPSAAEAPSTPSPVSPRKNGDGLHGSGSIMAAHQQPPISLGPTTRTSRRDVALGNGIVNAGPVTTTTIPSPAVHNGGSSNNNTVSSSNNNNGSSNHHSAVNGSSSGGHGTSRKNDEALWLWLAQQQQQQLLGHQAAAGLPFNPSSSGVDGSWFWQWYKQCSFPMVAQTAALAQQQQQQNSQQASALGQARKSPSKAKAMLDNLLCINNNNNNNNHSNNNNNNDSVRRCLNLSVNNHNGTSEDEEAGKTAEQPAVDVEDALDGGEKLFRYLDACSIPAVSRLQIIQLRYLLDNIKDSRKSRSVSKRRRK